MVQSLAKRGGGGHVCVSSETGAFRCLSGLYDQRPKKRGRNQGDTYLDPGDLGLLSESGVARLGDYSDWRVVCLAWGLDVRHRCLVQEGRLELSFVGRGKPG